jgi:hypothetical protein
MRGHPEAERPRGVIYAIVTVGENYDLEHIKSHLFT